MDVLEVGGQAGRHDDVLWRKALGRQNLRRTCKLGHDQATGCLDTPKKPGASDEEYVCGVLTAKMPSPEEAERLAQAMSTCPYSIAVGTSGDQFYNILVVPRTKMWWLEYPRDKPDIIGAISVDIATIDNLVSAVRFRQKDARISRKAPCGADCEDCGLRVQFQCRGCPATTPYR